jgi:hypothetical protein
VKDVASTPQGLAAEAGVVRVSVCEADTYRLLFQRQVTLPFVYSATVGWSERIRTPNYLINSQVFCQLNYTPISGLLKPSPLGRRRSDDLLFFRQALLPTELPGETL